MVMTADLRDFVNQLEASGELLRVKEVMTGTHVYANTDDSVEAVVERMNKEGYDWLPVVDSGGKLVGEVSMSALTGIGAQAIKDVMSPSEIASEVNAVLNEALSLMLSSGLKTLPIVGENNIDFIN